METLLEKTIYKNIFQLEPGSFLKFKDKKLKLDILVILKRKIKLKKLKQIN